MGGYTWTNDADTGLWGDANNWSPEGTPQDGDDVTIPAVDNQGLTAPNGPIGGPATQLNSLTLEGLTLYGGPFTVTDQLTWTGGNADCDLVLQGQGTINAIDQGPNRPGMINQHVLTVQGSVIVQGVSLTGTAGQFLLLTGSQLHNTGTLALVDAGLGGAGSITNDGTITVTGTCQITGATPLLHSQDGRLDLGDGATLVIGADTLLQLGGGTVTGPGVLRVGDGAGGSWTSFSR